MCRPRRARSRSRRRSGPGRRAAGRRWRAASRSRAGKPDGAASREKPSMPAGARGRSPTCRRRVMKRLTSRSMCSMSKNEPSKMNVNGIVGKPAAPTVAPGGSAAAASWVAGAGVAPRPGSTRRRRRARLRRVGSRRRRRRRGRGGAAGALAPLLSSFSERKSTFELCDGALQLVDQRRHVVVQRHGLAQPGDRGVVGVVVALGLLRGGHRGASRVEALLRGRDLGVDGLHLGPLGRDGQEPEAAQEGHGGDHHDHDAVTSGHLVPPVVLAGVVVLAGAVRPPRERRWPPRRRSPESAVAALAGVAGAS